MAANYNSTEFEEGVSKEGNLTSVPSVRCLNCTKISLVVDWCLKSLVNAEFICQDSQEIIDVGGTPVDSVAGCHVGVGSLVVAKIIALTS